MAEMIATLSDACEREFGFMASRLFRVFKTEDAQGKGHPVARQQRENAAFFLNTFFFSFTRHSYGLL